MVLLPAEDDELSVNLYVGLVSLCKHVCSR